MVTMQDQEGGRRNRVGGIVGRALALGTLGALCGAVLLILVYPFTDSVSIAFDRELPALVSGFHPSERGPEGYFAWTERRAALRLPGLDRRMSWGCAVDLHGGRPDPSTLPTITFEVDGVASASIKAANGFHRSSFQVPASQGRRGATLAIVSDRTFTPGPGDPRELGVMVRSFSCAPEPGSIVVPPRAALGAAALAAAALGIALGLTGITAGIAAGGTVFLAATQAVPLATGVGPYSVYPHTLAWLAAWISAVLVVAVRGIDVLRARPLRNTARFVAICSAAALYLELLVLFHPSKALVDALFHAHRFEWVLSGRFYFTQLSTSATPFPYAIGLYVFAAPWAFLTDNHVALLRVVTCSCHVLASGLLYGAVVRTWGDRLTGAIAVALANLVPLQYGIFGSANLANAFGQSVAVVTLVAATMWTLRPGHLRSVIGLTLLATLGFVSHVGTFAILFTTLVALSLIYRWGGERTLRVPSRVLLGVTAGSALLAVALYWGHFPGVYRSQIEKLRSGDAAVTAVGPAQPGVSNLAVSSAKDRPALGRRYVPLSRRVLDTLRYTAQGVGWPILALAALGVWRLGVSRLRDRLVFLVAAWGGTCLALVSVAILGAVDARYQQDAWEFIGRVEHATYPAAVILASRGAVWAWRARGTPRLACAVLLLGAVVVGGRAWASWLQ